VAGDAAIARDRRGVDQLSVGEGRDVQELREQGNLLYLLGPGLGEGERRVNMKFEPS